MQSKHARAIVLAIGIPSSFVCGSRTGATAGADDASSGDLDTPMDALGGESAAALEVTDVAVGGRAPGTTFDDWCARYQESLCRILFGCGDIAERARYVSACVFGYTDRTTCIEVRSYCDIVADSLARERATWNARVAEECLATLALARCEELFSAAGEVTWPPACAGVITGRVPIGEACSQPYECQDLYTTCAGGGRDVETFEPHDGVCTLQVEVGEHCRSTDECRSPATCSVVTSPRMCVEQRIDLGEPCGSSWDCRAPLVCSCETWDCVEL